MDFAAGIDGGGTKTTLICQTLDGKEILRKQYGAFNYNSVGDEAFRLRLSEIAFDINALGKCRFLFIGAAGSSNLKMREAVNEVLCAKGLDNYELVGDHVIALEGAHNGQAGLSVIAGTGSICFGKDKNGNIDRAGGWGHVIGDEGSGYALGRDLFSAVAAAIDGVGPETVLSRLLTEEKGLTSRAEIIGYVYSSDKSGIASVAPLVDKAYNLGDETAKQIIRENAHSLALQLKSLAGRLALEESADAALFGGLVDKDTPFKTEFEACLKTLCPGIRLIKPLASAAEGAVMLALKNV